MQDTHDDVFKCPRRTRRNKLFETIAQEAGKESFQRETKRRDIRKHLNKKTTGHKFERRLTRSTSKTDIHHSKLGEENLSLKLDGVLTRNRSKRFLINDLKAIREWSFKTQLKSNFSDSGYGTSSDSSKDCSESVTSGSRESFGSGLSESIKSWDLATCLEDGLCQSSSSEKASREKICETIMKHAQNKCKDIILSGKHSSKIHILLLTENNIKALVPMININNYTGPFTLQVDSHDKIDGDSVSSSMRIHHVSPVVSIEPHGIAFYNDMPAILVIPLRIEPRDESRLCCFYSNTKRKNKPDWQRLPKKDYIYRNGCLVVTAHHFSLFTVVLEEPFPEIFKKIRCRTGGRLRLPDVPGIEVNFPRGCLEHDIDAFLRVLFDNEPSFDAEVVNIPKHPLASPIISLGPHGLEFSKCRLPVLISLPIPDYQEIKKRCPSAKLIAYESSTADGEPMFWQKIDVEIAEPTAVGYRHGISGTPIPIVTFPVYHFSFFKVVWELLSSTLYEAKMGMSYFYPYISFSMMCQAFMEENNGNNRFGLEVICYRSDRKLPEATNYRRRVGASLKPKLVRPGKITVKLRSQMFEADVEAGEDVEMVKEEPDFRGRDFEKQYACKFKPESNIERGTFGKVIIERISPRHDPLFEFNLHKTGVETVEVPPAVNCERWIAFAMKDLASSLQITEGNNWKQLAEFIGFTSTEIENKLLYSPDPFITLMNTYNSRGGSSEEFIQALYVVSRDIQRQSTGSPGGSGHSQSSNQSGGSGSRRSGSQDSKESPMRKLWSMRPWGRMNRDSDSADSTPRASGSNEGKKRPRPNSNEKTDYVPKRRRFSDASETVQSTSTDDEVEDSKATEKYKNSTRKLKDKDLWRISFGVARRDWRNLGRTLGIEEIVLINLEHSHQSVGFRECAYQMLLEWKSRKPKKCTFGELYSALIREKMVSVAKYMVHKIDHIERKYEESDSN